MLSLNPLKWPLAIGRWLVARRRVRVTPSVAEDNDRSVFDAKGGTISVDGLKVRNVSEVFKLEDTDLDARNIDVR